MDYLQIRRNYVGTLDGLEKLALKDWTAWWDQTEGTGFLQRRKVLEEPFVAIARAYGEQAAAAAADYMFLQRSLDDTLAGLAYPEVAAPVEYGQAASAFRSAMRMSDAEWQQFVIDGDTTGIAEFNEKTFQKLSGVLNRVVLASARETISNNIAEGARFARVPEPGACHWCLMIASQGAVFSKDTVGMTKATRYHDFCRCVGIEVHDKAPLPRINGELEAAWKKATENSSGQAEMYRLWKNCLDRRSRVLQSQVRFPDIPGVTIPQYRGEPVRTVSLPAGKTMRIPLPDLHQAPGHVLYGWQTVPPWGRKRVSPRHRPPGDYMMDNRFGHKAGSKASGTKFPAEWADQQIVDAIRDTLEQGEVTVTYPKPGLVRDRDKNEWLPWYDYKIIVDNQIGSRTVRTVYYVVDGIAVQPSGYMWEG